MLVVFFIFIFCWESFFAGPFFVHHGKITKNLKKVTHTNLMPYGIVRHGSIAGINTATGTLFSAFTWAVLAG